MTLIPHPGLRATDCVFCFEFLFFFFFFTVLLWLHAYVLRAAEFSITLFRILILFAPEGVQWLVGDWGVHAASRGFVVR
jgi:hypothetical protein